MRLTELFEAKRTKFTPTMGYLTKAHDVDYVLWWYEYQQDSQFGEGLHTREAKIVQDPKDKEMRMARHMDFWPSGYEPAYRGRYDTRTGEITVFTRREQDYVPEFLISVLMQEFPKGHVV